MGATSLSCLKDTIKVSLFFQDPHLWYSQNIMCSRGCIVCVPCQAPQSLFSAFDQLWISFIASICYRMKLFSWGVRATHICGYRDVFRVQLETILIEENGSNMFFSRVRAYSQKYTMMLKDTNILRFNMCTSLYLFITYLIFGKNVVFGWSWYFIEKYLLFLVDYIYF